MGNGQGHDVLQSQLCRFEGRIGMRIFEGRGSLRALLPLSWRDPEGLTHTEGEQGRHSDMFQKQRGQDLANDTCWGGESQR